MDYAEILTVEPGKRGGKPCIRGLRITVYDVLDYIASGMNESEILADFPYSQRKTSTPAWRSPPTADAEQQAPPMIPDFDKFPSADCADAVAGHAMKRDFRENIA